MNNILKIEKYIKRRYFVEKFDQEDIRDVATFLLYGVGNDIEHVIDMIKEQDYYHSNIYIAELKDNYVMLYYERNEIADSYFIIRYDIFLDLLDKWKIVYKQRPDEIIISVDETTGYFTVQGQ